MEPGWVWEGKHPLPPFNKEASMEFTRAILTLLVFVTICPAQPFSISGTVKTGDGAGLQGVRVKLGKAGIVTTTATDGSFSLKENSATGITPKPHPAAFDNKHPFYLRENRLLFCATEQANVTVLGYDCNGKLLFSHKKTRFGANNSLTLPQRGSGVQFYRVCVNNERFTFKSVAGVPANYVQASPSKELGLGKQTKATSKIDDALLFIKQGYQFCSIAVTKPDSSGLQITMVPLDTGTLTDGEANVYRTVRIGNQYWTAENLRSTKYTDGSNIGSACYFYKNTTDAAAKKKWGALYTDAAANSGKLAPTGWRVPTTADWDTLVNYLISHRYNYDGRTKGDMTAKSLAAATGWPASTDSGAIGNDPSLNNASGFSIIPAGWKFFDFEKQDSGAYFWIAGKTAAANVLDVWWIFRSLDRYSTINYGASVRLVKLK
jgi:uncharacterized protein (TIGR02145 family)